MKIDEKLLEIICCPETRQGLSFAEDSLIERLNELIDKGALLNRSKQPVKERIDSGLVREDGMYLYPIIGDIPILLIDESIPLGNM